MQKKYCSIILFITILVIASSVTAQQRVTYKVLGMSVTGNKSADASTIIANTGISIGDEINIPGDQTNNAIKRLWNLGIFEDVQLLVEKKVEDGIFIQIAIKEYPRLEKIVFVGNDELSETDLNKKVTISRGQTLKAQEISRLIAKIKSAYIDEGYLNAVITPHRFFFFRADTSDGEVTITWRNEKNLSEEYQTTFDIDKNSTMNSVSRIKERVLVMLKIDEKSEVLITSIKFNGNQAFEDDDLKSEFDETKENKWWKFWSSPKLKRDKFEKDKELLVKFYRKNGYRDFVILSDTAIISEDNTKLELVINVYEGKQYKIRNIEWEGNVVFPVEELNARLGFKKGDVFDYEKFGQNLRYNEKQNDVSSLYQDTGYLGFQLDAKENKVSDDSVDIKVKMNEGNRYKIGKVDITGNTRTKDKVIRRELYTIPGSYFSRSYILRSIQQLSNLQYFNVEELYKGIDYRPSNDSTVNISYKVSEKSSDFINASVGYSGAFGFSGSIGFTLSNFSISEPFQMGGGQILNFNWQFGVGNYYQTFSLGFTEPWFMDTPTSIGFDLFDTRQRYIYDMRQSGISLRMGKRLTWPDDFFYVQGSLRFQYNDVINGQGVYQTGLTRQYSMGFGISRTDIDNPIFPSGGSRGSVGSKFAFNAELSGGPFLPGNVDFYKIDLKTEWYKSLFRSNKFVLYTSAEFGHIGELVKGTQIPIFEQYYMGGNGMVMSTIPLRGYDDRSLGDKSGESAYILGSKFMMKFTTEFRVALAIEPMPIYVLAFAEAGNVFLNLNQANFYDLKRSVGVGARILLNPIGLIGFDYGYGFDRRSVDGKDPQWVFHFQFGKGF